MDMMTGLNMRQSNYLAKAVQEQYDSATAHAKNVVTSKYFQSDASTFMKDVLQRFVDDREALQGISIGLWDRYIGTAMVIGSLLDKVGLTGVSAPGEILEHFDLLSRKDEVEAILTEAYHTGVRDSLNDFCRRAFMELASEELKKSKSTKLETKTLAPLVKAFTTAETKAIWQSTSDQKLSDQQVAKLSKLSDDVAVLGLAMVSQLPTATFEREVLDRANLHPKFVVKEPEFMKSIQEGGDALDEIVKGSSTPGLDSDFREDLYEAYFADKFDPRSRLEKFDDGTIAEADLESFLEVAHYTSVEKALEARINSTLKGMSVAEAVVGTNLSAEDTLDKADKFLRDLNFKDDHARGVKIERTNYSVSRMYRVPSFYTKTEHHSEPKFTGQSRLQKLVNDSLPSDLKNKVKVSTSDSEKGWFDITLTTATLKEITAVTVEDTIEHKGQHWKVIIDLSAKTVGIWNGDTEEYYEAEGVDPHTLNGRFESALMYVLKKHKLD